MQAAAFVGLPAQRFADLRASVAQYQAASLGVQAAGFLLQQHCAGEVDEVHLAGVQHQPWPVTLAHEALQVVAGAEEDRAFDA